MMLSGSVTWPPITSDMKRHVKVIYEDDLFSLADYNEAIEFKDEDAFNWTDDSDEDAIDAT